MNGRTQRPQSSGSLSGARWAIVRTPWNSKNAAFQELLQQLLRFAKHGAVPILLEGESGTGKSCMARQIHEASPRSTKPFREVMLSSLEDALAGSDLFGHVAGAFTDARQARTGALLSANGGTLFLDELGKASASVQMKLLGSIEGGVVTQQGADREIRVDVRLVAATSVSIDDLVREGRFLPDLAARLGLFRVVLPPLRERREDIADLVGVLVARRAQHFGYAQGPRVDGDLMAALHAADWPLNIRQLDAAIQRLLMEADGADVLTLRHCGGDLQYLCQSAKRPKARDVSVATVRRADVASESRAELAARLGISEATLYRRLRGTRHEGDSGEHTSA